MTGATGLVAGRRAWVALLTVSLGLFMAMLDSTIVNIAIPAVLSDLDAGLDLSVWVLNSYILALAVLYLTGGRVGDLLGARRAFIAGMVVFTAASVLCGIAGSTWVLIGSRVLQGAGAALLTPQVMVLAVALFPPGRRGVALGFTGAVSSLAAVLGPSLGGVLVDRFGWRSVFFVNVPIGVATVVLAFFAVPTLRIGGRTRFDLTGLLLGSAGLSLLSFGLIEGERYHWGQIWSVVSIPVVLVAGVALLGLFFRTQRAPHALLPRSLLGDHRFLAMSGVLAAAQFALLGTYLPLTIHLQSALLLEPLAAGLALASLPLTSAVSALVAGRLTDRFGGRGTLLTGLVLSAAGAALLVFSVDPAGRGWELQPALVLSGAGLGFTFAPVTALAMRGVALEIAGTAAGVLNTARLLGNLLGAAVVGALLQVRLAREIAEQVPGRAAQLPEALRPAFLDLADRASSAGLLVPGGLNPPGSPPVPPAVQAAFQAMFTDAFVAALRVSLLPCIVVLGIAVALTWWRARAGSVSP